MDGKQDDRGDDHTRYRAHNFDELHADKAAHNLDIRAAPLHQVTHRGVLVIIVWHILQMLIERVAQRHGRAFGGKVDEARAHMRAKAVQQRQEEQQHGAGSEVVSRTLWPAQMVHKGTKNAGEGDILPRED